VARRKKARSTVYIVSIGVHLVLALAIAFIPQKALREVVAIALADTPKPKEAAKPPPPPPARAESRVARSAISHSAATETPTADDTAAKAAPVFTDIGLALDSSSADGLPIHIAPAMQSAAAAKSAFAPTKPKLLVAKSNDVPCSEELVKAVPLSRPSPKYTPEAENSGIEGKVRLELKVNDQGDVEEARVLQGLGYGLDEAAIQTVKRWRFRPAALCGKPVAASFVVSVVFSGS
jgi:periplasmic protein TonB